MSDNTSKTSMHESIGNEAVIMRRTVVESTGGAETLLGQTVYLACTSYAYTGVLTGVNDKFVELENPHIVYETGPWSSTQWKDAQKLPTDRLVVYQAQIESMFAVKR